MHLERIMAGRDRGNGSWARRWWRGRRAALFLASLVLASFAAATAAAPPLSLRIERAEDAARAVRDGRGVLVEVTSPSGIGRMLIATPARRAWPSPLRLRLRYAPGRPFRTLEGLDVSVDGTVVATRESMRVRAGRDWLEVVLPADVAVPGKPIRVQWVDAYR
jgi:hypothetical protein